MTVFEPRNKSRYIGKHGRLLMSRVGRECVVLARGEHPADQTSDRKPYPYAIIRFVGDPHVPFQVRPQDIREAE